MFREFPHKDAALAAFMLARCAPKEKYFPLIDVLFDTQHGVAAESRSTGCYKIAQQAGFTQESFDACMKNETVAKGYHGGARQGGQGIRGRPASDLLRQWRKILKARRRLKPSRAKIDPLLDVRSGQALGLGA